MTGSRRRRLVKLRIRTRNGSVRLVGQATSQWLGERRLLPSSSGTSRDKNKEKNEMEKLKKGESIVGGGVARRETEKQGGAGYCTFLKGII